jgi:hypothetical protein
MDPTALAADEYSAGGQVIPGQPVVPGQPEFPGGPAYQGPQMPGFASGLMPGEQPVYPAEVAAAGSDPCYGMPGGSFMRPCFFDDYWDYTGNRSPTEYACWNGYGPDWCHTWNARVEWLMWFSEPRNIPPLAQTIGPLSGLRTIIGDEPLGSNLRNGARITLGRNLGDSPVRVEGRFWGVEDGSERVVATTEDNGFISIPLIDTATGLPLNIVISAPGIVTNGGIDVLGKNDLFGADAWLRQTWWDDGFFHFDGLVGYQFLRMDDMVEIRTASTVAQSQAITVTQDRFVTNNEFHGGSLGLVGEWRKHALSFELLGKLALGNMRERVLIDGRSVTTPAGGSPAPSSIGIFARTPNEGEDVVNRFTVVPELNANAVIHLTPAWRITAGYSLLYLDQAKLAGDQIDRRRGAGFPRPLNRETTYFIQGMNLGLDYRW